MRNPTLERFAILQSRVDKANEALTQARLSRASDRRIAELGDAVKDAKLRIQQEISASTDPAEAMGLAKLAAEDRERPSRPASIGDLVVASAEQRAAARAARRNAA